MNLNNIYRAARTRDDTPVSEIAARLAEHAEPLCRDLLPGGVKIGNEWKCGSILGGPGKSLSVCLSGEKRGVWCDFNGGEYKGDMLALIQATRRCDKGEAVQWAKDYLGTSDLVPAKSNGQARKDRPDEGQPVYSKPGKAPSPEQFFKGSAAAWEYKGNQGETLMWSVRFDKPGEGKDVKPKKDVKPLTLWRAPDGREAWCWKALPAPRPLFNIDKLVARPDAPVLMVEGEKSVIGAERFFRDYVATTWPGGTGQVERFKPDTLKGRKVFLWPDNDESGRMAMQRAGVRLMEAGAAEVRMVALPDGLPPGWDLADPFPAGLDIAWARKLLDDAPILDAAKETNIGDSVNFDGWSEPDISAVNEGRRPPPDFPLKAFGPFWSDWIARQAEAKNSPVDYVAMPLLAGAASLMGNARRASPWPGWSEPSIIWAQMVGHSGSGKSPGADPVMDILRPIEDELARDMGDKLIEYETRREEAKALRDRWKEEVKDAVKNSTAPPVMPKEAVEPDRPARPRLRVSDITPESLGHLLSANPKGLLFYRDELAGWFGGFDRYGGAGSERAMWIEAYGGREFIIDRVKNDEPIRVPYLSVCVLGGVQPDRLATAMLSGDDDGLQARFLCCWPHSVKPARPRHIADSGQASTALRRLFALPIDEEIAGEDETPALRPRVLMLEDAAQDIFQEWWEEHGELNTAGRFASHMAKLPGYVVRLSLVLEHLWWSHQDSPAPPTRISTAAVTGALMLIEDYFKPMAERVYADAALPENERLGTALARHIVQERIERFNSRDLYRKAGGTPLINNADTANMAVKELENADWIRPDIPSAGQDKRGRKKHDYVVNPKIWEAMP